MGLPKKAEIYSNWNLSDDIVFLNHGSFGATPKAIMEEQRKWQDLMERDPVKFFEEIAPEALLNSRKAIAKIIKCHFDDIALIDNATTGVNIVLRSLKFNEGDEILVPNHAYQACRNAIDFIAMRYSVNVKISKIPFPINNNDEIIENIISSITEKTRLVMIDTVTSPTGLRMPFEQLVPMIESRGINVLLDAAHGVGIVPLNLESLGASFTTSNCHKWLFCPKGVAFLHVRKDLQGLIKPLVISHGMTSPLQEMSRFRHEFDWTGTKDLSGFCVLPFVIEHINQIGGSIDEIMRKNRKLLIFARNLICERLKIDKPCPDYMITSIATIKLPVNLLSKNEFPNIQDPDPLHWQLMKKYQIQVPVWYWPDPEGRYIRISSQIYNNEEEYKYLAESLVDLLNKV